MPLSGFDSKILNLLKEKHLLSNDQYGEIEELYNKSKNNKTIDEILIENDYLDEEMYISTIAEASSLAPINLDKVHPDLELKEEIPEDLVTYHNIFPIAKVGNTLSVAVTNPFDVISHDDFKVIVGYELKKTISTVSGIQRAVKKFYHAEDLKVNEFLSGFSDEDDDNVEVKEHMEDEEVDLENVEAKAGEVVDVVNKILINSVRTRCSDIHFEPQEKSLRVRSRIDGVLSETSIIPKRLARKLVSRLKVMTSEMDISESRLPQDGSFRLLIGGKHVDFRISSLPTVRGEKIEVRIMDKSILNFSLEELGFNQQVLDNVRWAINQPYGMILCNGPTGCGKTTTLYTCLQEIQDVTENITTVEEPVEYEIYGVNQVNVQPDQGRTFPSALRSILRQDPDTILIGEIRDSETIDIAVKAALTGHRVFSTLHTSDAASTIQRILGLGLEPFLVGSSLLLILSQRLPRKLCPHCKETMPRPTNESLIHFGFSEETAEDTTYDLFKAVGCSKCKTGYTGRFAICESLRVDEEIAKMIIEKHNSYEIKNRAVEKGMKTLRESGIEAITKGMTTFEEVKKVTGL